MPRRPMERGVKGSLKWIQALVNKYPTTLSRVIDFGPVTWRSPLAAQGYAEYWDDEFLDVLGIHGLKRSLASFWPRSGPRWDALGVSATGTPVLVEAKAHEAELLSATAASPGSRLMIERAFAEVAAGWRVAITPAWTDTYYQYANRLAHAFFLNELNARPAVLAFVNICGDPDMGGPAGRQGWEAELDKVHRKLRVLGKLPPYVVDVFIDASTGRPVAA
jgi:hypothetical protein